MLTLWPFRASASLRRKILVGVPRGHGSGHAATTATLSLLECAGPARHAYFIACDICEVIPAARTILIDIVYTGFGHAKATRSHLSIRRSLALSYAQKYTSMLLHFVSMVIIARLMAPAEVGVFAAGAAIVALGGVLAEFGQEAYLIQKAVLTSRQTRAAFALAWTSSWISSMLLAASAILFIPSEQSQLLAVVLVLAAALALRPFSLVMRAALLRDLKFDRLYAVNLSKDAVIVAGSVALVYLGYSAVGLAWGLLLEQVTLIAWAAAHHARSGWVRPSFKYIGELFHFGYLGTGIFGLAELGASLSRLTIGGFLGYGALGLLNRAQKITTIFDKTMVEGMLPVLLPYLSNRVRKGAGVNEFMAVKVAILSAIAWPFFACLAIVAEPAVVILLGERWIEAAPVIQVLCLAGFVLPFSAGVFSFLIAHGLLRPYLPIQFLIQIVVVAVAVLGSLVSVEVACLAFVTAQVLKAAASTWLLRDRAGLKFGTFLPSLRAGAVLTALTAATALAATQLPWGAVTVVVAAGASCSLVWLAVVFVIDHPLAAEIRRLGRRFIAYGFALRKGWNR